MKKTFIRIIALIAMMATLLATVAIPASATTVFSKVADPVKKDIYLKIDGIEGEANDSKHDKWIDVLEFKHASVQSVQTGSANAEGEGSFEPFIFKHYVDKATPKLHEACMKGNHIKSAELHFCRAIAGKQEVYYKVKFEGIKIVRAEVSTEDLPDGTHQLVETVHFLSNKQTWTEVTVGLDNTIGGDTEANYDQSKKGSMFDSNTSVALTVAVAVIFVLLVVIAVMFVSRKKKASAAVAANSAGEQT